jgi:hypothetical protein
MLRRKIDLSLVSSKGDRIGRPYSCVTILNQFPGISHRNYTMPITVFHLPNFRLSSDSL